MTHPIIIIGSGLAGYTLAREFRKLDTATPLTIITEDDGGFYSKPMLSNALCKNKTSAELCTASAEKMAEDLAAVIITRTSVTEIRPESASLLTGDGNEFQYSKLVFANGASPVRLPLPGSMISVNNLEDYACFRDALGTDAEVVIIGSGLIGCEFANDLVATGYRVTVVGLDEWPLQQVLPREAGEYLVNALQGKGVQWQLQTTVKHIQQDGEAQLIKLENGQEIKAGVVLSAIGLRPAIALAQKAGIDCGRGIRVNRHLQTSAENIYALGDVTEVEGLWLPYVMPLMNGARSLAKTLAGTLTTVNYPVMPVVVKTPACPLVFALPTDRRGLHWQLESSDSGVKALLVNAENILHGFVLVGSYTDEKQALVKAMPAVLE